MAELAPLISAHAHARKAAEETQYVHWSTAADEHQSAVGDFARATKSTSDTEALRVLRLLEQQHQKLARILRSHDTHDGAESTADHAATRTPTPQIFASPPASAKSTTKPKSTTTALAAARIGSQTRDSSPSLAREIASRRGIPQSARTQPSPTAQARARQLSPESPRSTRTGHAPRVPPSVFDSQASLAQVRRAKSNEDDDGFAKFYSSLTTGTMSKLSSVLAYAGLPLTADDIEPEHANPPKSRKQTVTAGNDPDVRKIFSKAALDAIEEEQRQRGTLGRGFGPAESFYVVPPTGMTTSFADIARRRGLEDDEDDFVDAREAPGPASPRQSHSAQTDRRGSFGKARTQEELELENTTLKLTLEQLAGRLANFEAHAQDASMAALTQSMVSLRHPAHAAPDTGTLDRLRQLEEQAARDAEEKQKLQTYATQQERELKKWDLRFAKLKDGARSKQKAKDMARESPIDTPDVAEPGDAG